MHIGDTPEEAAFRAEAHAWLKTHAGKQIAAPKTYGNVKHKAIENAPGRYVKARASN